MIDQGASHRRPDEAEIKAAIRGMAEPRPDSAYRERIRRGFITGELGKDRPGGGRRWFGLPPAVVWMSAPAAVALVILFFGLNRGPGWTPVEGTGSGRIIIDGRSIAADDLSSLRRHLRPGASISVAGDAELVLRYPGAVLFDLAPGTDLTLPALRGRWSAGAADARLEHGELRVMTDRGFPGRRLEIRTADGTTRLTGTVLSVYTTDEFTCVCVLEGTALVGVEEGTMDAVPAGMRKVLFRNGSAPLLSPAEPEHLAGLAEFVGKHR